MEEMISELTLFSKDPGLHLLGMAKFNPNSPVEILNSVSYLENSLISASFSLASSFRSQFRAHICKAVKVTRGNIGHKCPSKDNMFALLEKKRKRGTQWKKQKLL